MSWRSHPLIARSSPKPMSRKVACDEPRQHSGHVSKPIAYASKNRANQHGKITQGSLSIWRLAESARTWGLTNQGIRRLAACAKRCRRCVRVDRWVSYPDGNAHSKGSVRCPRFWAGADASGQNSTKRVTLPWATVKKVIARSVRTPSVTVTSETTSDSPPTSLLTVKRQGPFAGYSRFMRQPLGSADALLGLGPLEHKLARQYGAHQ